jgi:hypothetical protein
MSDFHFFIGQEVSTVTKKNFGLDKCCAGRIAARRKTEVGAEYRIKVDREHWHPESEVFTGDDATAAANRANNAPPPEKPD